MPRGTRKTHTVLNLTEPDNVVVNNLGGMGPNNGSFARGSFGGIDNTAAHNQPNFIMLGNVGTFMGQQVALRIDNCSVYKPDRVQNNRKMFNYLMQVNLHPVQDFFNVDNPYDVLGGFPANVLALVPAALRNFELATKNSNQLSLFYSFFNQATGAPLELDEFMVAFYDFDQSWADGNKAYVRETKAEAAERKEGPDERIVTDGTLHTLIEESDKIQYLSKFLGL